MFIFVCKDYVPNIYSNFFPTSSTGIKLYIDNMYKMHKWGDDAPQKFCTILDIILPDGGGGAGDGDGSILQSDKKNFQW